MPKITRQNDISDKTWSLIEPQILGRKGSWGGVAKDNRQFVNAVFWIFRTGSPWRELPKEYGGWSNTHRRFIRWRNAGIWEKILEQLIDLPDYEWLINSPNQQQTTEEKRSSTQSSIFPWIRMICRSELLLRKAQKTSAA